jgi:hypothetical protein
MPRVRAGNTRDFSLTARLSSSKRLGKICHFTTKKLEQDTHESEVGQCQHPEGTNGRRPVHRPVGPVGGRLKPRNRQGYGKHLAMPINNRDLGRRSAQNRASRHPLLE